MICRGGRVRCALMLSVTAAFSSTVGEAVLARGAVTDGADGEGLVRPNGNVPSPPAALTKILGKTSFITFGSP